VKKELLIGWRQVVWRIPALNEALHAALGITEEPSFQAHLLRAMQNRLAIEGADVLAE
jgi:hypothetical protein